MNERGSSDGPGCLGMLLLIGFVVLAVGAAGKAVGCGGSSSDSQHSQHRVERKVAPEPVRLSTKQVDALALGITQRFRGEAAVFGENADYSVRCRQVGETDRAKCQVTPFIEGEYLPTYTRMITFDPAKFTK